MVTKEREYLLPVVVLGMQRKVLITRDVVGDELWVCLVRLLYIGKEVSVSVNLMEDGVSIGSNTNAFLAMTFHVAVATVEQTSEPE